MSDDAIIASVIERIRTIRINKSGPARSPHKYVLLRALVTLYERSTTRANAFPLNSELEEAFRETWLKWFPDSPSEDILIEYPYFHLSMDGLWQLRVRKGKEDVFRAYVESPHTRLTKTRLCETVECAQLDKDFDWCCRSDAGRREIAVALDRELGNIADPHVRNPRQGPRDCAPTSLFVHEASAQQAISDRVKSQGLGYSLTNLEIHDPQSNRYFETDLVVICPYGIYVVELKHWSGDIEVRPNSWVQNRSFYKRDPHKANNFKAKLLRGLYEKQFPHFPSVYFESVVVLTNPDVTVNGAATPSSKSNNPTFAGIDRFMRYLSRQREDKGQALDASQCRAFLDLLRTVRSPGPPRDFVFPGYEIVERLYQDSDRAELVARRTDVRHHRLSRIRIFFPPVLGDSREVSLFHERATATLNAVAKTGDHPNILKVWSIPNENNYVVEGSDWSETGTLRDLMAEEKSLPLERTCRIICGMLEGLGAIHKELVIHRALSPLNIMMAGDVPKLMNFDLSYQLEDNRTTVIPDASKLKRTAYMAPEIYEGGITPEATADLFSVGVIIYEMLLGERPFARSLDLERLGGALDAKRLEKLTKAGVPEDVRDLLKDLIRTKPETRPSSARNVIERLRAETTEVVPAPMMNRQLSPNERSGLYEIEEFIARGAQSQTYRARGARAKLVALKLFDSDVALQQVVEEQQYAGIVHDPSVVRVDSYGRWEDGRFYISFDWMSARSMRTDILGSQRPSSECFRNVASALLGAIASLHSVRETGVEGILHNDIKPENVLLAEGERPVLIDFGCASSPRIGLYQGTEGYVAPDLYVGEDRKYCEDGDLYAIGVTLHEWLLGHRPASEEDTARGVSDSGLPAGVAEWLGRATAQGAEERFGSAQEMIDALENAFATAGVLGRVEAPGVSASLEEEEATAASTRPEPTGPVSEACLDPNPFLAYLNSLHSINAASENALAESQARNDFFGFIHVAHPVADVIESLLIGRERRHVILTGHAGDGKSTVVVELYKRFMKLPVSEPLADDLEPRVDLDVDQIGGLSLIKDLSEWARPDRQRLADEMLGSRCNRLLLVSNTGTLLDTFREAEKRAGGDPIEIESELLGLLDSFSPQPWKYRNTAFTVINLSMIDNLNVAREILDRMIHRDRWTACESSDCRERCPVYRNVRLIQENRHTVSSRMFMAYRRMYEYGIRLTLRQLSAHLAYMITSGLTRAEVVRMSQKASVPPMSEFMFFNRFFGDNGKAVDFEATQLRAVREVRQQGFGTRTAPTCERGLWLQRKGLSFRLNAADCDEEFEILRRHGAGLQSDESLRGDLARNQARRMVFFLHKFPGNDDGAFVKAFLGSSMILDFCRWQTDSNAELSLGESRQLLSRILHVLQEHFTGVRLPEGTASGHHLFITLSRRSPEVRQSAQVVLARIPEEDLILEFAVRDDGCKGVRRELLLRGREGRLNAELQLGLPFLDYVMMRNEGELGEVLQTAYVDRLERFKGQLLREAGRDHSDDVMLVRLRTNHTFRRQIFAVHKNRLEVTDD